MSVNSNAAVGAVACGHPLTAEAGAEILKEGGNAIDAVIAALLCACVTEPVLASLGGGGFLLARRADGATRLFDFFTQTPRNARPLADFYPIEADFGEARQTFHIGLGAAAVPGVVAGIDAMHHWGASMPLSRLAQPACRAAREGVVVNEFQGYIFDIVRPIYEATLEARRHYGRDAAAQGKLLKQPELADTIELIAREGARAFYLGEPGRRLIELCNDHGGHLRSEDLSDYEVHSREPLRFQYRDHTVLTNPAPSAGGELVRFTLGLLEAATVGPDSWGGMDHVAALCHAMHRTNQARTLLLSDPDAANRLLADERLQVSRGTTHISTIDAGGGLAAMTVSNGEGCGHVIPGTGVMLNNMLGEEDINPEGPGRWPAGKRMGSMMAPTLVRLPQGEVALGSGGSNRIRSAILQVLVNLIDYSMLPEDAVRAPRLHLEEQTLSAEPGFEPAALSEAQRTLGLPEVHQWDAANLFFGGVHLVGHTDAGFSACADARRGGSGLIVS